MIAPCSVSKCVYCPPIICKDRLRWMNKTNTMYTACTLSNAVHNNSCLQSRRCEYPGLRTPRMGYETSRSRVRFMICTAI